MANTTYPIPTNQQARMDEALALLCAHLPAYRVLYNADLVSVTRQGVNWNIVLTNPIPDAESKHIKITV